jgi:hypothetical protein
MIKASVRPKVIFCFTCRPANAISRLIAGRTTPPPSTAAMWLMRKHPWWKGKAGARQMQV